MSQRLSVGDRCPTFTVSDLSGRSLSPDQLRGAPSLLFFLRFVGCPTCNLTTRDLAAHAAEFRAKGVELVVFYESSAANLRKAIETWGPLPFMAVPDLERRAYDAFGLETSIYGTMVGMTRFSDTRRSKAVGLPKGSRWMAR